MRQQIDKGQIAEIGVVGELVDRWHATKPPFKIDPSNYLRHKYTPNVPTIQKYFCVKRTHLSRFQEKDLLNFAQANILIMS